MSLTAAGRLALFHNKQNIQIFNLAKLVAESIDLPFNYEWYGSPDKRSYRVGFSKIKESIDFRPKYTPKEGAKEVFAALKDGRASGDDPRTITVKWYKHLLREHSKEIEIKGVIL